MNKLIAVFTVSAMSVAGVIGLTSVASSSSTTTTTTPIYVEYAWVPVVTCATSTGINRPPPTIVQKTKFLEVPSNLLGNVSYYTDIFGWVTPLLGPSNWDCAVTEGADGTYGIIIEPPIGKPGNEVIGASSNGPCSLCVFDVACPWLSKKLQKQMNPTNNPTCSRPPRRQNDRIKSISADTSSATIAITNPPGVTGSLIPFDTSPSNSYSSEGYVVYNIKKSEALVLTCTLPKSERDVCQLIESHFLSSKWGQ